MRVSGTEVTDSRSSTYDKDKLFSCFKNSRRARTTTHVGVLLHRQTRSQTVSRSMEFANLVIFFLATNLPPTKM